MPKYLSMSSYTEEGIKGLMKEGGTSRREAVQKLIESVGGKMEAFYYAFGQTDLFVIADLPDNATAAALQITAAASGAATTKLVTLLTAEEIDEATKKTADYRPPGK